MVAKDGPFGHILDGMAIEGADLSDFKPYPAQGEHPVYAIGEPAHPPVLLMHEIPNLSKMVLGLAKRISAEGFFVVVPSLFGTPFESGPLALPKAFARLCFAEEFRVWSSEESGTIVDWLKGLCRQLHNEHGGKGVGAIGLCITGNFALTLIADADAKVVAPVMGEPSLPLPFGCARQAALNMSRADLAKIKARIKEENLRVLGLRFTTDSISPGARFETLRRELGSHFEGIEIETGGAIPHGAHSVLTKDFLDQQGSPTREALDKVLALLTEKLK